MTIADALIQGSAEKADKEILLASILKKDRSWLHAYPEYEVKSEERSLYESFLSRREKGEPVAYILGEKEFFGRMFYVTPDTLIPRPATELLIENAAKILRKEKIDSIIDIDTDIVAWSETKSSIDDVKTIIDIGTGSGCIAITLACELPAFRIIATDISETALQVARKNAERHGVLDRIEFRVGFGTKPIIDITEPFFVVSNPPYIPEKTKLEKDVQDFEPHIALFSGKEGMDVLKKMINDLRVSPFCRGFCIECKAEQAQNLIA